MHGNPKLLLLLEAASTPLGISIKSKIAHWNKQKNIWLLLYFKNNRSQWAIPIMLCVCICLKEDFVPAVCVTVAVDMTLTSAAWRWALQDILMHGQDWKSTNHIAERKESQSMKLLRTKKDISRSIVFKWKMWQVYKKTYYPKNMLKWCFVCILWHSNNVADSAVAVVWCWLTLWWDPIFVRTAWQTAVVGIESGHVTCSIAPRGWAFDLSFLWSRTICEQQNTCQLYFI